MNLADCPDFYRQEGRVSGHSIEEAQEKTQL